MSLSESLKFQYLFGGSNVISGGTEDEETATVTKEVVEDSLGIEDVTTVGVDGTCETDIVEGSTTTKETGVEVGEVMIHRRNVQMIDMTLPLDEIIDQVISSPYTRIPLWCDNKDNIVGILHVKALLRALNLAQKTSQSIDILQSFFAQYQHVL